jgi:hypothetical protein
VAITFVHPKWLSSRVALLKRRQKIYEISSRIPGFGLADEVIHPIDLGNRVAKDIEAACAQYRGIPGHGKILL